MQKDNYQRTTIFIIAILFIGYLIGTMTHILHLLDVIKLGFYNSAKAYRATPVINAYWLSLTIIDPIIAFLLLKNTKIGAILAFINILVNVIVNSGLQISTLPIISPKTIYDSLGNIFNSLQLALFVFSIITLPVIIIGKGRYVEFFRKFPFFVLLMGLVIHLSGLIRLIFHFESLWVLWVHISMVIIDGALFYLLFKKLKIAYILGLALFGTFGMIQAGFAIAIFMGIECPFNLAMAVTISLCCLSIIGLMLNRDNFTYQINHIRKQEITK